MQGTLVGRGDTIWRCGAVPLLVHSAESYPLQSAAAPALSEKHRRQHCCREEPAVAEVPDLDQPGLRLKEFAQRAPGLDREELVAHDDGEVSAFLERLDHRDDKRVREIHSTPEAVSCRQFLRPIGAEYLGAHVRRVGNDDVEPRLGERDTLGEERLLRLL